MLERPRSRSPINHSPPSHSPSFASCGSAHSPPAALCRGPERNGLGPHRSSWVWPSHVRRSEEERDREDPWRNGGSVDDDLPNGRAAARRNTYQKHSDFGDGMRDNRERPPRGSPQGFSSYRSLEDHFYSEQMYKSEKCLRPSYPRHDMKTKRRDGGDYHVRYRHPDFNLAEEPPCRPAEGSPGRRSKRSSRRQESAEKHEKETENNESGSKEKSISPQENTKTKEEDGDAKKHQESGEDTDEECWFPTNMEELVTVDEVGGEDDSIIEPDLPEVEGFASCPKETGVEASVEKPPAPPSLEPQEILTQKPEQENSGEETGVQTEACVSNKEGDEATASSPEEQKAEPEGSGPPVTHFPREDLKAAVEEMCLDDHTEPPTEPQEDTMENPVCSPEDSQNQEEQAAELIHNKDPSTEESPQKEMEVPASSAAQDKAVSEHSIPLGVEFIVPSSGFYCKLCELFYTSESAAKTTHCRSTVHYKNLQKYLSQLAEDSLSSVLN